MDDRGRPCRRRPRRRQSGVVLDAAVFMSFSPSLVERAGFAVCDGPADVAGIVARMSARVPAAVSAAWRVTRSAVPCWPGLKTTTSAIESHLFDGALERYALRAPRIDPVEDLTLNLLQISSLIVVLMAAFGVVNHLFLRPPCHRHPRRRIGCVAGGHGAGCGAARPRHRGDARGVVLVSVPVRSSKACSGSCSSLVRSTSSSIS